MRVTVLTLIVVVLAGCDASTSQDVPEVMENSIGMKLVRIPAGEFEMGSEDTSAKLRLAGFFLPDNPDVMDMWMNLERPVHRERFTKPFLMGQTEVTQEQWQKVIEPSSMWASPWKLRRYAQEGPDVAATYVRYIDAEQFCERLTKLEQSSGKLRTNQRYRLPTEAEWEYACRAGTKTRFSFGDDESQLREYAWFEGDARGENEEYALKVSQKKPNAWGLYDMHGNVWEWCSTPITIGYYESSQAPADVAFPHLSRGPALRGGSWGEFPVNCRSARRAVAPAGYLDPGVGFRVVCESE